MSIIDIIEKKFSCANELEEFIRELETPWYAIERVAMCDDNPNDPELGLWRFSSSRRRLIHAIWPNITIVFDDSREWEDWIKCDIAKGRGKPYETFSEWYPGDWIVKNYWYEGCDCSEWAGSFKLAYHEAREDFFKYAEKELFEDKIHSDEFFFYSWAKWKVLT